jgi:hypothetical protein
MKAGTESTRSDEDASRGTLESRDVETRSEDRGKRVEVR